jgi:hypothetical protein
MVNEEQLWGEIAILKQRAIQHSVSRSYPDQPLDAAWHDLLAYRTPQAARFARDVALRCYELRLESAKRRRKKVRFASDEVRSLQTLADTAQMMAWLLESKDAIRETSGQ